MALKPALLLLLWGLTLNIHDVASLCNVTCTTNYINTLNCSCWGPEPPSPVPLNVSCRDEDEIVVGGSCVIEPPRSWCTIIQEALKEVASVGTICTVLGPAPSVSWELCNVVKPEPPVDVTVMNTTAVLNITWRSSNTRHEFTYRVRVRTAAGPFQDPFYLFSDDEFVLTSPKMLQEDAVYFVDVQNKMRPGYFLQGPWSEWSPAVEWRTRRSSAGDRGMNILWLYISMPIILVLALLLLGYLHRPCWQQKLNMFMYIPKPSEYFKPLYHNYEGNFKEWVKPVFKEYDYLTIDPSVQMMSEKQNILQWKNEKQSFSEDEMKEGRDFLHASKNLLQDDSSSQSTSHSTGHISIHTVTLSGEELEGEVSSQSSLRSYQEGVSFGSFENAGREHAGYQLEDAPVSRRDRQSGISLQNVNDLLMENLNYEAERVSLDSFVSNEQSEDGYPRVDLDTIDSGYGDCSSPGASDSNPAGQMDSFHEHKNSNYVRQWMICSTIQEDPSNVNNELHETQQQQQQQQQQQL